MLPIIHGFNKIKVLHNIFHHILDSIAIEKEKIFF